jgi:hypothetical protein
MRPGLPKIDLMLRERIQRYFEVAKMQFPRTERDVAMLANFLVSELVGWMGSFPGGMQQET